MKAIALIVISAFTILTTCKAQKIVFKGPDSPDVGSPILDPNKTFKTQGEQEDYWAQELFKQKYKKQKYSKYKDVIKMTGDNQVVFGNEYIEINVPEFKSIFINGILYPQLIGFGSSLRINYMEEIKFVYHSEKVKRFRFWVFYKSFANPLVYNMNPIVYFIELTNKRATNRTNNEDFIKGAELTYLRQGGVII